MSFSAVYTKTFQERPNLLSSVLKQHPLWCQLNRQTLHLSLDSKQPLCDTAYSIGHWVNTACKTDSEFNYCVQLGKASADTCCFRSLANIREGLETLSEDYREERCPTKSRRCQAASQRTPGKWRWVTSKLHVNKGANGLPLIRLSLCSASIGAPCQSVVIIVLACCVVRWRVSTVVWRFVVITLPYIRSLHSSQTFWCSTLQTLFLSSAKLSGRSTCFSGIVSWPLAGRSAAPSLPLLEAAGPLVWRETLRFYIFFRCSWDGQVSLLADEELPLKAISGRIALIDGGCALERLVRTFEATLNVVHNVYTLDEHRSEILTWSFKSILFVSILVSVWMPHFRVIELDFNRQRSDQRASTVWS